MHCFWEHSLSGHKGGLMISAKNANMAIYFADQDYLENFMDYISERNTGFICSGFTRSENLKAFAEKNAIAVLLTDDECFKKNARNINSEITVILTEKPGGETGDNIYEIDILQPVDEIVRAILKAAAKTDITLSNSFMRPAGDIHIFYSPVGRSLKTTFAVAASQLLSDRSKTIYLNLEPDSGFTVLFRQDYGTDLSDLMFFLRDDTHGKASLMLQSAICSSQGVSYIPPVTDPGDLFHISCDEILRLFDLLRENGYGNIVVDMGTLLPGFEKILSAGSRIYMPVRKDAMSKAKTAHFLSFLRTLEDTQPEEKLIRLEPPYFEDIPPITSNLRGSEAASYIAGYLM